MNTNGLNYANTNGTCTIPVPLVAVSASNSITGKTFNISFLNAATGYFFSFTLPYSTTSITPGNIPVGTYTVSISPVGTYTTAYSFQVGNYALTGQNTLSVSGVAINTIYDAAILVNPIGAIE